MRLNNLLLIAGIGVIALLFGFFMFSSHGVRALNAEEFASITESEDVFTLQVHTPYYGEIPNTDLVVEDWENVESYIDELPDKNKPIAVYCRSGRMSGIISQKLSDLGYKKIYNLEGGMNAWEQSGRTLIVNDL